MKRRVENIYWLAGLLEGEGCFITHVITKNTRNGKFDYKQFQFKLQMNDRDIVERAAALIGSNPTIHKREYRFHYNKKPGYEIHINGSLAIQWMMTIYTLMGIRRREKIREIIEEWKTYKTRFPSMQWSN